MEGLNSSNPLAGDFLALLKRHQLLSITPSIPGNHPEFKETTDEVFEYHGVPVVIDKKSLLYLSGAHIDYHDELHRSGFSITNPNAKSTCGCGSSFSM